MICGSVDALPTFTVYGYVPGGPVGTPDFGCAVLKVLSLNGFACDVGKVTVKLQPPLQVHSAC